jgi:hypothetical protein
MRSGTLPALAAPPWPLNLAFHNSLLSTAKGGLRRRFSTKRWSSIFAPLKLWLKRKESGAFSEEFVEEVVIGMNIGTHREKARALLLKLRQFLAVISSSDLTIRLQESRVSKNVDFLKNNTIIVLNEVKMKLIILWY